MLFKHDKEKRKEIEEVKAAVNIDEPIEEPVIDEAEEMPLFDEYPEQEEQAQPPLRQMQPPQRQFQPMPRYAPEQMPMRNMPARQMPVQERAEQAPLFVKVDKYNELISSLQEMRLFVSSIKDVFAVMQEIEHIRNDALNILKVTVQRLEKSVVEMDSELLRPKGMTSSVPHGQTEARHIESSLSDLQQQLMDLRKELQGVR